MRIFGRLACEYAVDMFPWTEEEHLRYLKLGRRVQAAGFSVKHVPNRLGAVVTFYAPLANPQGTQQPITVMIRSKN